ncbi:MAG: hypothetical protein ACI4TU_08765 [Candidatus Cryptobacteroides sp.]
MKYSYNHLTFKTLAICLILYSANLDLRAQAQEGEIYRQAAGVKSLIFRGRIAPEYKFGYNGHCYAEKKEFTLGSVMYNERLYENVLLNVDACADLLLVRNTMAMSTVRDYVDYALIGSDRYVNLNYNGRCQGAPEGFCKELCSGAGMTFYSKVSKKISTDEGYHNGKDIGYEDPDYSEYLSTPSGNVKVLRYFRFKERFYLVRDGKAVQILNRRSFLKQFDRHLASKLKHYASSHGLNAADVTLPDYACGLLSYLEGEK